MAGVNKTNMSETDIISKFILPAVKDAGWDDLTQIRQEVKLRDGKIVVRGKLASRIKVKSADIVLYHKPNLPLAVIEAKANKHAISKGMQQGLDYAGLLDVPFVFASNGDGFIFHDKTNPQQLESEITLDAFPAPELLWQKYCDWKGFTQQQLPVISQDYYDDGSGKSPRYYQMRAINRTIDAVSAGKNRILLVMATGTGKTYTAFQIIWRLWKARNKKRILFLADRNILVDQTKNNDFQPFGTAMTKVTGRTIDPAYEVHLALYQAITGPEENQKAYKQVAPDFFDLIVIDECHRGSASEDSAWREILEYFGSATQIGLTATPKETEDVSNIDYFGEPVYTYSLKEGIEDGFLAPYKVVRVDIDVDVQGWRPVKGQLDKYGKEIEDRIYNLKDFDRTLVIDERTMLVAKTITDYLKRTNPMDKTIVFCNDIDHAERMRHALVVLNQVLKNEKYVMKITGDDDIGKAQLDNFINPKKPYPVIATTSELMSTGVDAQTCKLVVLDQNIQSITKFKQIIGRGTRINEKYGKLWFTILDFKKATELFADERFDGVPEKVLVVRPGDISDQDSDFNEQLDAENDDNTAGEAREDTADYQVNRDRSEGCGEFHSDDDDDKVRKFYVNGVHVKVLAKRVQYYDSDGKLVTESFRDYTRKTMLKDSEYASLDGFMRKWKNAPRKQVIIEELEQLGILWDVLAEEVGKDLDPFDLLCHVVYGQPPLTRQERAANVRKRNYFTKYAEPAQQVLNTLLDKYADEGVQEIEDVLVLKLKPFDALGRPGEIIRAGFGNKAAYEQAVNELENEIYRLPPRLA